MRANQLARCLGRREGRGGPGLPGFLGCRRSAACSFQGPRGAPGGLRERLLVPLFLRSSPAPSGPPLPRPRRGSDGARPPPLRAPGLCPQRETPGRFSPGVRGPCGGGGNAAAVAALAAGRAAGGGRSRSALIAVRDATFACARFPRPPRGAGARCGMRRRLHAGERPAPRPPGPPQAPACRARRSRPGRPR